MQKNKLHQKLEEAIIWQASPDNYDFDKLYQLNIEKLALETEVHMIRNSQPRVYKLIKDIGGFCRIAYEASATTEKSVMRGASLMNLSLRSSDQNVKYVSQIYPDISNEDYETIAKLGVRPLHRMLTKLGRLSSRAIEVTEPYYEADQEYDFQVLGSTAMIGFMALARQHDIEIDSWWRELYQDTDIVQTRYQQNHRALSKQPAIVRDYFNNKDSNSRMPAIVGL